MFDGREKAFFENHFPKGKSLKKASAKME